MAKCVGCEKLYSKVFEKEGSYKSFCVTCLKEEGHYPCFSCGKGHRFGETCIFSDNFDDEAFAANTLMYCNASLPLKEEDDRLEQVEKELQRTKRALETVEKRLASVEKRARVIGLVFAQDEGVEVV